MEPKTNINYDSRRFSYGKWFFSHLRWSCKFSWKTNLDEDVVLDRLQSRLKANDISPKI